jgi:hypothetical protein
MGEVRGLGPGEAVVSAADLAALGDRLYLLRAALDDTADDVRGDPGAAGWKAAYRHLRLAAGELAGTRLEPTALGGEGTRPDTSL